MVYNIVKSGLVVFLSASTAGHGPTRHVKWWLLDFTNAENENDQISVGKWDFWLRARTSLDEIGKTVYLVVEEALAHLPVQSPFHYLSSPRRSRESKFRQRAFSRLCDPNEDQRPPNLPKHELGSPSSLGTSLLWFSIPPKVENVIQKWRQSFLYNQIDGFSDFVQRCSSTESKTPFPHTNLVILIFRFCEIEEPSLYVARRPVTDCALGVGWGTSKKSWVTRLPAFRWERSGGGSNWQYFFGNDQLENFL